MPDDPSAPPAPHKTERAVQHVCCYVGTMCLCTALLGWARDLLQVPQDWRWFTAVCLIAAVGAVNWWMATRTTRSTTHA